jgi:hypothetical protein
MGFWICFNCGAAFLKGKMEGGIYLLMEIIAIQN